MSFLRQHKQSIITYFSELNHWRYRFDSDPIDRYFAGRERSAKFVSPHNFVGPKNAKDSAALKKLKDHDIFRSAQSPYIVSLDESVAEHVGLSVEQLRDFVKLILAVDLGIEPDISTFNALDPEKFGHTMHHLNTNAYLDAIGQDGQRNLIVKEELLDASVLEKAWDDTMEFEGYYIGTPTNFLVQKTNSGYAVRVPLNVRDKILTCSVIFREAHGQNMVSTRVYRDDMSAHSLLDSISNGPTMPNHAGEEWNYTAFEASSLAALKKLRSFMADSLRMDQHRHVVIALDDNMVLVAAHHKSLENTIRKVWDNELPIQDSSGLAGNDNSLY